MAVRSRAWVGVTSRGALLGGALLGGGLLGGGAGGCSSEDPAGGPPSAPDIVAESFDLAGHCARVCRRASACGVEKAEALARSGPEADRAALAQLRAAQGEVERECVVQCSEAPPAQSDREAARRATRCLDQPDCASLEACLLDVAG